jgi:hypothetical protein
MIQARFFPQKTGLLLTAFIISTVLVGIPIFPAIPADPNPTFFTLIYFDWV